MDTGILGFFLLLFCLIVFLYFQYRRYRTVEKNLVSKGFGTTKSCPSEISLLLSKIISREPRVCYKAYNSPIWHEDTWIIELKDNPADEDSTIECAFVTKLPRHTEKTFVLRSISGASAKSWLGKAAISLSEIDFKKENKLHRLKDSENILDFNGFGFVAYGQVEANVTQALPSSLIMALNRDISKRIWHLVINENYLMIHTSWSSITSLLDYSFHIYNIVKTEFR